MTKTFVLWGPGRYDLLVYSTSFLWKIKPLLHSCWREWKKNLSFPCWMNVAVSASPFRHCYVPTRGVRFQRVTQPRQSQTYFLSAPKIEIAPASKRGWKLPTNVGGRWLPTSNIGSFLYKVIRFFLESTVAQRIMQNLLIFLNWLGSVSTKTHELCRCHLRFSLKKILLRGPFPSEQLFPNLCCF